MNIVCRFLLVTAIACLTFTGLSAQADLSAMYKEGVDLVNKAKMENNQEQQKTMLVRAESLFTNVVAVRSNSANSWYYLAVTQMMQGKKEDAAKSLKRAMLEAANITNPPERRQFDINIAALFEIITNMPGDKIADVTDIEGQRLVLVQKGEEAAGGNKPDEVIKLLELTVADWPADKEYTQRAYFLIGKAYQDSNSFEGAKKWYEQYQAAAPTGKDAEDATARLRVVDRHLLAKKSENAAGGDQWAEVIRLLGPAVDKWPADQEETHKACFLLGKAYQAANNWDTARHWYQRYLEFAPTGIYAVDCKDRLGIVRRGYWDEGIKEIQALLASTTKPSEQIYTECMGVISRLEKFAILGVSDEGELTYCKGIICAGVHRNNEAKQLFADYIQQAPNGRFTDSARFYLMQFDRPHLLYIQGGRLKSVGDDGSEPNVISANEHGDVLQAAVSPSRDRVAMVTWSEQTQASSVYILDLGTGKPACVWTGRGRDNIIRDLQWSPSIEFPRQTRYLSFIASDAAGDYAIWVCDIAKPKPEAKSVARSNTSRANQERLLYRWAPNGAYLAYCAQDGQLYISRTPFEAAQTLQFDVTIQHKGLAWAEGLGADLDPVLFGLSPRGVFTVSGKDLASSKTTLTYLEKINKRVGSSVDAIGVSSDGDVIALLRKDNLELFSAKDSQMLGTAIPNVTEFAFSPIGSKLAYRTGDSIYVSRIDTDRLHDIRLSGTDGTTSFAWSPIGNQIAWWRNGRVTLCFDRAQLGGDVVDPPAPLSSPRWAVDDRAVAFQDSTEKNESILILVRGTGEAKQQLRKLVLREAGSAQLIDWIK